jgi:two-component system chemotaxis response regulator CheY
MVASLGLVLVVDDEPDLRFILRVYFERAGHQVIEAGNGEAALQLVTECHPNLVVTDIRMPIMDGLTLIKILRADHATVDIPILVMSSDLASTGGADASLRKPYDKDELIEVAARLLAVGSDRK